MTEQEWQACTEPQRMLVFLRDKISERKLRLYVVACCRAIWPLIINNQRRAVVETAERYADGEVAAHHLSEVLRTADPNFRQLFNAYSPARYGPSQPPKDDDAACAAYAVYLSVILVTPPEYFFYDHDGADRAAAAAHAAAKSAAQRHQWRVWREAFGNARAAQSRLLRDVTWSHFRLSPICPAWLAWNGGIVPSLAQAAYRERDLPSGHLAPARLAVLADALGEVGCTDPAMLTHLRDPGPHVRGCWAVDLLLGKS